MEIHGKRLLALAMCGLLVTGLLAGCGEAKTKETELTWENIGEYLAIDISYSNAGNRMGRTILEQTIKIYPVKDGSFNNVELLLVPDAQTGWELIHPSSTCVQCSDEDAVLYEFSIARVTLPSDGYYECTHEFKGLGLTKVPSDYAYEWSDMDTEVDKYWVEAFGDFVELGEPIITGTFKEN